MTALLPTLFLPEDEEEPYFLPDDTDISMKRERPKIRYIYPDVQAAKRRKRPFMLPREPGEPVSAYPLAKHTARSCEVTGQCKKCLDMFTVSLYLSNGQLKVSETPRLKVVERRPYTFIYHRPLPDCCGGEVSLYGSTEQLSGNHAPEYRA